MSTPEEHGTHIPPAPQTAPTYSAAGMVRIGHSPLRAVWWLILLITLVMAWVLPPRTADIAADPAWGWAGLAIAVLVGGGLWAGIALFFRPVAFDPAAGLARLGRTTVPVASVTAAQREVSAGSASAYLRYRFTATNGAWGRVVVTGRPIRGLRPEEVSLLEQLVAASGIPDAPAPGPGLSQSQQLAADAIGLSNVSALNSYSSRTPVGKQEILAELRGEPPGPAADEVDPVSLLPEWAPQWSQDDQEAESVVLRSGADAVRRVFGWLAVGSGVTAGAGLAFAVIQEQAPGGLDSASNDVVTGLLALAAALGLVSFAGYATARLVSLRRAQHAVLIWLRDRDAQQVVRGLPPRLVTPFHTSPPAYPLQMFGGIAGTSLGGIGLLGGLIGVIDPTSMPAAVMAGLLLAGGALVGVGVVLLVRARRALREQHQLAVRLGGWRLVVGR